jgi:hypothetical protein
MTTTDLDLAARHVLGQYSGLTSLPSVEPLGSRGGFSGALLWRITSGDHHFCLRAWPESGPDPDYLHWVHQLMTTARRAGLAFVPAIQLTAQGRSLVHHAQQLWELTEWMPGVADFHEHRSPARLRAACTALARLHQVWAAIDTVEGRCPGLLRRLERIEAWRRLAAAGWRPAACADPADPVAAWVAPASRLVSAMAGRVVTWLLPWVDRRLPLHPCLCDLWHDHVLYMHDSVSGLVDYGSVKVDHPSVDLARLLGSLVGDDAAGWEAGFNAYRALHPLAEEEGRLARALDWSGVVVAAANWLMWLYRDGREVDNRGAVALRLAALVERMQRWV